MCLKGANRSHKNYQDKNAHDLAKDANLPKNFLAVLSNPWYSGCPIGKLPFMPIERTNRAEIVFVVLFAFVFINSVFVIEPVLDVWYFMLSTSMCCSKLLLAWIYMTYKKPGYVTPELEWSKLIEKVPSKHLCFECKVIKPPRSHHCSICNKCVDRFEAHSVWTNNCVGRQNAGYYFAFIFYVALVTLLMGWLAMDSIPIKHCEIDHCIYESLCFYCDNLYVHNLVCYFDMIVCFAFMIPAFYHTAI